MEQRYNKCDVIVIPTRQWLLQTVILQILIAGQSLLLKHKKTQTGVLLCKRKRNCFAQSKKFSKNGLAALFLRYMHFWFICRYSGWLPNINQLSTSYTLQFLRYSRDKILKVKITTVRAKAKSELHHDVSYLHPSHITTKYQLPTPYSFRDIARTRF